MLETLLHSPIDTSTMSQDTDDGHVDPSVEEVLNSQMFKLPGVTRRTSFVQEVQVTETPPGQVAKVDEVNPVVIEETWPIVVDGEGVDVVAGEATEPVVLEENTMQAGKSCIKGHEMDELVPTQLSFVIEEVLPTLMRVVFFLPWCVLVGATIVLVPQQLELVAFSPGYTPPQRGIHRFAYWAEYGSQFVVIFLGAATLSSWWCPIEVGMVLFGAVLALFVGSWGDFEVDVGKPLGDDDRQSVWVILRYGGSLRIKRNGEDGFVVDPDGNAEEDEDEEEETYVSAPEEEGGDRDGC